MIKYVIFTLSAVLIVVSALCWGLYEKRRLLASELNEARANYEIIKAHIEFQNRQIQQASDELQGYQSKIAEIELKYQIELKNFEKQIANIKTCEDSDIYFKNLLKEIEDLRK